jgi:hypothetical protein
MAVLPEGTVMSVSSIDPSTLGLVAPTSPIDPGTVTASGLDADGDADGSTGAATSVSPFAQLLSQLQQLQQTDPAKLKTVLTDVANALQGAAQQAGSQGQFLAGVASRFQEAAQTGDLSLLQPAGRHHGHHHHHHPPGAAAYQQSSGQPFAAATGGSGAVAASPTDPRTQVIDIIDQVLAQDLGSSATV